MNKLDDYGCAGGMRRETPGAANAARKFWLFVYGP